MNFFMKRIKNYFLFLVIGTSILHSCNKKQNVLTYYIPNELKEYAVFQPGSYWVFKNDLTEKFDTSNIIIAPNFSYYHEGGYNSDPIWEKCTLYYKGSFLFSAYLDPYLYSLDIHGHVFEPLNPQSFTPGKVFKLDARTTLNYSGIIDTLTIFGKSYQNVFTTTNSFVNQQNDTVNNICYFVKMIGLIKYIHSEAGQDSTWSLYDYHVIN
jgi:hypothetical protein